MRLALIAILTLAACGRGKKEEPDPPAMPGAELVAKATLYASLIEGRRDADGFIETDTCDSVHWSALAAAATREINIRAAIDRDHRVYRRPLSLPECYATRRADGSRLSAATISNDALLFVLAYAVHFHDMPLVRDIFSYGHDHSWRMGDGDPFTTVMRPTLISLYARALLAMGGPDFPIERQSTTFTTEVATGFEAHLQVVSILVLLSVEGSVPEAAVNVLRQQVARQPDNALFRAALGRFDPTQQAEAQRLLLNAAWWPADRLPTSADRCEAWLTQRDQDQKDWLPCGEGRTHSGGDLLAAFAVLTGVF